MSTNGKDCLPAGLYGMADAGFGDVSAQVERLAAAGVQVVQLRCKGWSDAALAPVARAARARVPILVVNDRVDVARAAGAWVHLGQDDGPGPADLPWGRSCHRLDEVRALGAAGERLPTYIGFGPVFGTTTKDTGFDARGVEMLAQAVALSPVPVVAIGGITVDNVDAVRATGARMWAVVGGVWRAPDPEAAIRALDRPGAVTPATR